MTHASVQLMIRTDARNASIEWPRSHDARRNRNDAHVRDNVRAASIATARAFAALRTPRNALRARRETRAGHAVHGSRRCIVGLLRLRAHPRINALLLHYFEKRHARAPVIGL